MNLQPGSTTAFLNEVFPRERTRFCDNCGRECADGHTVHDRHFHCCRCDAKSAKEHGPANYHVELCEPCQPDLIGNCTFCELEVFEGQSIVIHGKLYHDDRECTRETEAA